MNDIIKIETISQMAKSLNLPSPMHPLVYVMDVCSFKIPKSMQEARVMSGFYSIFLKDANCAIQYGRNTYDFNEGVLSFFAPGQVTTGNQSDNESTYGWALFFHPDLIRSTHLGTIIESYGFFSYDVHEALHLSKKEEGILNDCIEKINLELNGSIDGHSKSVLCSNIELLLNYCNRFYERQFHTRSDFNKDTISIFDKELKSYFDQGIQTKEGLPSTRYLAEKVNLSANYLGDLLKKETGKNTKEHINEYVVDKAKTILLNTNLNIAEIAYDLGFNYPHYFSRLFKQKTGISPAGYRELNIN